MEETKNKISQKYRKQSENRGVCPEERNKEFMVGMIYGRDW